MATQPNPWEIDWTRQGAAPSPAPAPISTRPGRPRLPAPHPEQTSDEAALDRANRELAETRAALAARTAADPAGDTGVEQRKSAGFFLRARNADDIFTRLGVAPRGVTGEMIAEAGPQHIVNANTSPARQRAESAQRDFIAATLRYESGAAIPPSEFETQRAIFFPMPGDTETTIRQKAQARATAIESLRIGGGQAAGTVPPIPRFEPEPGQEMAGMRASDVGESVARVAHGQSAALPGYAPAAPQNGQPAPRHGQQPPGTTLEFGRGPDASPPGSAEFRRDLETAINSDTFRTPEDIINFSRERGFNIDRAQAERAIQSRARGVAVGVHEPEYQAPDISDARGGPPTAGASIGMFGVPLVSLNTEQLDATIRGAADTVSVGLGDRVSAAGTTLFSGGTYDENLRREHAITDYDTEHNFAPRVTGQLAGAFALPGVPVSGLGRQAAFSGGYGAAYGFNAGRGNIGERFENALVGGTVGLAIPPVLRGGGRAISAFRGRGSAVTTESANIARAAEEEGIPISRPIVDPSSRDRMMHLESTVGTGERIRAPLRSTESAIEARVERLHGDGTVEEAGTMGQRIQAAGRRYIDRSRSVATRAYDRAATLARGNTAKGTEAVAALDAHIADLSRNANSNRPLISYLNELRSDFVDDAGNVIPKDIGAIRDLRTSLRGQISSRNLTATDAERRIGEVLDAAGQDIRRDLGASAPQAVRQYARADNIWRQRQTEIREVVQRVIGRRDDQLSGEQVMSRLRALAGPRGDSGRLTRLWARLEPEERADAAATIAAAAGRASPEEVFSPARFVSWARTLSPAARRTIFGPEGAQSISNLRTVASAFEATTKRLNLTRSGAAANWRSFFTELLGGNTAGALAGVSVGGTATSALVGAASVAAATTGAGLLARRMSARVLMSPDMSRWLETGARLTGPAAIRGHVARLSSIAARDPAIAQEVLGLRQALLNAVNDNIAPASGRAAASPDEGPNR